MKSLMARVVAVGLGLAVALVLVEGVLRLVYPPYTNFYVWPPGTSMVFRPMPSVLSGVSDPARFVINAQGIRGRLVPAGPAYRVLAVGGSTTECAYLDGPKTWTAILETLLPATSSGAPLWVGNVGRSGMNSRDHVVHVKYLPREYPWLDAVVVLVGVNDLAVSLGQTGPYTPPPPWSAPDAEARQIRRAFAIAPGGLTTTPTDDLLVTGSTWPKQTAIYQLVKRARRAIRDRAAQGGLLQDVSGQTVATWREHRRRAGRILETLPPLGPALKEYATNLETIVSEARARSLRVVLLTQPTLWRADLPAEARDLLWLGGIGNFQEEPGHDYYSPAALADAMRQFNDTLLSVCRARDVECLDLAERVPRETTAFYDDTHFTEHGARLVAEAVAEFLRGRAPFGPARLEAAGRP